MVSGFGGRGVGCAGVEVWSFLGVWLGWDAWNGLGGGLRYQCWRCVVELNVISFEELELFGIYIKRRLTAEGPEVRYEYIGIRKTRNPAYLPCHYCGCCKYYHECIHSFINSWICEAAKDLQHLFLGRSWAPEYELRASITSFPRSREV